MERVGQGLSGTARTCGDLRGGVLAAEVEDDPTITTQFGILADETAFPAGEQLPRQESPSAPVITLTSSGRSIGR